MSVHRRCVLTGLSVLAGIVAIFLAENFSTIFPKTPPDLIGEIRFALPLLAVGLWLSFISSILGNLLAAKEALYVTNAYSLITLLVRSIAIYLVLEAGHGIDALVLVTLGTSLLGALLTLWSVRRAFASDMPSFIVFSTSRLQEMWRFGLASFVARTSSTMANDSAPDHRHVDSGAGGSGDLLDCLDLDPECPARSRSGR